MNVKINIDASDIDRQIKKLAHIAKGGEKAVTRALNYAVKGMKTEAKKGIKEEYTVKSISVAANTIQIKRANYGSLSAEMRSTNRPIALTKFAYRRNVRKRGGATAYAHPKRSGSGGETGGFVSAAGSHTGIFKRKGSARLPIEQLYGPSGTEMLNNPIVKERIEKEGGERFMKEFDRQVELLLK